MLPGGPVNWEQMEWEMVREGVKRKVFHGEGCTLVLNALEPGHQPMPHAHPHEQIIYILQGDAEFTVGEKVFRLSAGGLLAIPPNVKHFINVLGKQTCLDLDTFVPRREDYVASKVSR